MNNFLDVFDVFKFLGRVLGWCRYWFREVFYDVDSAVQTAPEACKSRPGVRCWPGDKRASIWFLRLRTWLTCGILLTSDRALGSSETFLGVGGVGVLALAMHRGSSGCSMVPLGRDAISVLVL